MTPAPPIGTAGATRSAAAGEAAAIEASLALRFPGFGLEVELRAPGEGVTALFGPSGSGKTTVLRCVAGLQRAGRQGGAPSGGGNPAGRVRVGGAVWQDEARGIFLPPHRRPIGLVFQEQSLFPHLTVRRNLEYGWRRVAPAERRIPFETVERLLGLGPLLPRATQGLSGGERQRAALGRALLTSPRLMLLDEPLASLDAASKAEIIPYLERLRGELALPMLYVSHDVEEVARLADHVVLLREGRVAGAGPAAVMLGALGTASGEAGGLGAGEAGAPVAVIEARVERYDAQDRLAELTFPGGRLYCPSEAPPPAPTVRVRIHARDVSLALHPPPGLSILNVLPATVTAVAPSGPAAWLVTLDVAGTPLHAAISRRSLRNLGIAPGTTCHALVKAVSLAG